MYLYVLKLVLYKIYILKIIYYPTTIFSLVNVYFGKE